MYSLYTTLSIIYYNSRDHVLVEGFHYIIVRYIAGVHC